MDNKLLELLYCPVSQTRLDYNREAQVLISQAARLVFPVRDGIPIMLESEAISLDVWEKEHQKKDEKPSTLAPADQKIPKKTTAKKTASKKVVAKKTSVKKSAAKKTAKTEN